jgi:hypothetical protein
MIKEEKIIQFEKSLMSILKQHFDYQWDFKAVRITKGGLQINIIIKEDK